MQPIDLNRFEKSTDVADCASLVRMAVFALEAGVSPELVAERLRSATSGYDHVSYAAEALASDIEDLGAA